MIDEVTNVYALGVAAFASFGDERDRCMEKWNMGQGLFEVAEKAVNKERGKRQQSIRQLIAEWETAKVLSPSSL